MTVLNRYEFETEVTTGRQITEAPAVPGDYALYRPMQGGNEPIVDDEQTNLQRGDHFFARPVVAS